MRYCIKCVLPDTRPGLEIGADGVCSGCAGHTEKHKSIDWQKRQKIFESIVTDVKKRTRGYDCIIPVSGGKDSTWQVVKCLEYGLRILAVTWKTPSRTKVGQANLENLIHLGVDHIDFTINPEVERLFTYKAFEQVGDPGLPMHMAIYAIPLKLALALDIPLVVWGESPHMEYGGSDSDRLINTLDLEWFQRHNILQGTSAKDWVDEELTPKQMEAYFLPTAEEFQKKQMRSVFLGYYFPWDVEESLRVAKKNGFQVRKEGPKMGLYNYADIDCNFISVHHFFKWYKYGFTRLFDNLALEIRNGRMSRDEAINTIGAIGDQTPYEDIATMCTFLGIPDKHFWEIAEKYRNPDIWKKAADKWVIKDFLIPNWKWI
jgi:N-acetyl sugar amidotransferase